MAMETEDHLTAGLARLLQQYKDKPLVLGLFTAFLGPAQALEDALWDLLEQRTLETAVGAQLDVLGRLLGEDRKGRDDAGYRLALRVRIKLNLCSGTAPQLLELFDLALSGTDTEQTLAEEAPAGFSLTLTGEGVAADLAAALLGILREARAAAVRGILISSPADDEHTLRLWDESVTELEQVLNGDQGAGTASLQMTTNGAVPFPAAPGWLVIDPGGPNMEVVHYIAKGASSFLLDPPMLLPHFDGDPVRVPPYLTGLSDETGNTPDPGGQFSHAEV